MAKVTQPLGSIEARGSVGGLTYNTWRGIRTVKTRSGPAALPSPLMLQILAYAASATTTWKTITQAERDRWNAWAVDRREPMWTGQDKRLTGYNWFVRLQVRQQLLGNIPDDFPPNYAIKWSIENLRLDLIAGDMLLWWTDPGIPDVNDYYVEIYRAGPLSAGRNATIHDAFRVTAVQFFLEGYSWSAPAPGTYTCFARLLHYNGLVTPFQSARLTVT